MESDESSIEPRTYYIYRIFALDSEKYYYGVSHVKVAGASREDCEAHRYMGSGGLKFSNWKFRHRSSLQKEVLDTFITREEAFNAEAELIGDRYKTDPLCLNSTSGGKYAGPVTVGVNLRECSNHGFVAHNDSYCYSCLADERFSLKECSIHGLTKHSGVSCVTCINRGNFSQRECSVHGLTTFRGNSCDRCSQDAAVITKECPIHGFAKHIGTVCYPCISMNADVYRTGHCKVHGEVIFRKDSCATCSVQASITMKECSIHGLTKHKGGCCACIAQSSVIELQCSIHGSVKTQNGLCSRCEGSQRFYIDSCEVHGETKHRRNSRSCIRCEAAARNMLRDCAIHGKTMHQSNSCVACVADRSRHTRDHIKKGAPNPNCIYCLQGGLLPLL